MNYLSKNVADRNPVMAGNYNRSQIAVKRLTCCNNLESEIPTGIKVNFENIISRNLLQSFLLGAVNVMLAHKMWSKVLVIA